MSSTIYYLRLAVALAALFALQVPFVQSARALPAVSSPCTDYLC